MNQGLYDGSYTFLSRCQCYKVMREGSELENQSLQPRASKWTRNTQNGMTSSHLLTWIKTTTPLKYRYNHIVTFSLTLLDNESSVIDLKKHLLLVPIIIVLK